MDRSPNPTFTFMPGLHGTEALFEKVKSILPADIKTEFINLPSSGKQDYTTLSHWLNENMKQKASRVVIAESFSGPLAIRLAALRPNEVSAVVLAASFCETPLNPGIAMLPLRPLFMVKPSRKALRHFLIGEDATDAELAELRAVIRDIPSSTLAKRVRTIINLEDDDNPPLPKIPMLILQAQNDNLIPWDAQSHLISSYPKASVHWIESPHLIFQREPKQCLDLIFEFVNSATT